VVSIRPKDPKKKMPGRGEKKEMPPTRHLPTANHVAWLMFFSMMACSGPMSQVPVLPAPPPTPATPAAIEKVAVADVNGITSVAVLPIRAKGDANPRVVEVLDDLLLTSLQRAAGKRLRVIGKSDIDAALGYEKAKDAAGCNDVSCVADIAGALGVDTIISATGGMLGSKYVLTLAWIDQRNARPLYRQSKTLGSNVEKFDVAVSEFADEVFGKRTAKAAAVNLNGEWLAEVELQDRWRIDRMRIVQQDGQVTGTFGTGGTLIGTLSDRTLSGTSTLGAFTVEVSADGRTFSGSWSTPAGTSLAWQGVRHARVAGVDFSGEWRGGFDAEGGYVKVIVRCAQDGNLVACAHDYGTTIGIIDGRSWRGVWQYRQGFGRCGDTLSEDGLSYTGTWGNGKEATQYAARAHR
jgi:hypothetical protein